MTFMDLLRVNYCGCEVLATAPKYEADVGDFVQLEAGKDQLGEVKAIARMVDEDVMNVISTRYVGVLKVFKKSWEQPEKKEDDA